MERFVTRRALLGTAAALSVTAAAASLSACGSTADPEKNKKAAEANAKAILPNYFPVSLVKPDLPGTDIVPSGYFSYPRNPAKAVTDAPGAGLDKVSIMYNTYLPAPRDAASNSFWSSLQTSLGTTLNLQPVASGDYTTKFQAMTAGGDLPDIMNFPAATPDRPRVMERLFADLGPLLAGDAIKQFPFLANIPQYSWRSAVSNGTIYAVPQQRSVTGALAVFYRGDIFTRLGLSAEVKNGEDFVALAKALTNPQQQRWAFSNVPNVHAVLGVMMGAPNGWSESNGVFTPAYDHPAYKEAMIKTAELVKAGCAHPTSATIAYEQNRQYFYAGTTGLLLDGPAGWDLYARSVPADAKLSMMVLPKWDGSGPSVQYAGTGIQGITAINKKLTGDKLVAALRVLNYLAAPIGSAEHLQRKFGAEGTDFTWTDGRPKLTEQGNKQFLDLQYIVDSPITLGPAPQEQVEIQHNWATQVAKNLVFNPTVGLYSDTNTSKGTPATKALTDVVTGVLFGRNSPADFDAALKKWHTDAGDKIAQEFAEAKAVMPR